VGKPRLCPAEEKTKGGLGTYKLFSDEINTDVVEMREFSLRVLSYLTLAR